MTADDIMATYPNIKLKRDIPATTINGVKTTIKEGEKLTPYELKGNKILLQDGKTYIVSKNQFQNIKGQSVVAEGKPFAPELKQTEETIKGGKMSFDEYMKENAQIHGWGDWKKTLNKDQKENWKNQYDNMGGGENTKYSQYTLPGGENYREVLIKAPTGNYNLDTWAKNWYNNLLKN